MKKQSLVPVSPQACQVGVQAQLDYWDLVEKEAVSGQLELNAI